jgi:RNA polymerase sigma factor (sigma-70 family)
LTPGCPDGELITRSCSDPQSFSGIFDRHYAALYRYLRKRIGSEVAADLAAETFVAAFAARAAYHPEGDDCRPWLYGIAHNLLRTHLRSERRQLAAFARHGVDPLADAAASAEFSLADE